MATARACSAVLATATNTTFKNSGPEKVSEVQRIAARGLPDWPAPVQWGPSPPDTRAYEAPGNYPGPSPEVAAFSPVPHRQPLVNLSTWCDVVGRYRSRRSSSKETMARFPINRNRACTIANGADHRSERRVTTG